MPRENQYSFVDVNPEAEVAALTRLHRQITGYAVQPASPERLLVQWLAAAMLLVKQETNTAANKNLPSRAAGSDLNALGELFFASQRPQAKAAGCTVRFHLSEAQRFPVRVPAGTRVTDAGNALLWATQDEQYIPAGETVADIPVLCLTTGSVGNGYAVGQLDTVVDLFEYCSSVENLTVTAGGSDAATDDEYYELLRLSQDAWSCAGARGGYIYWAKQVSTKIADVTAVCTGPATVSLYALMDDGTPAGDEMKRQILAACSEETVRPLTDRVQVSDPENVPYRIAFTWYRDGETSKSAESVKAGVERAVTQYIAWQGGKFGRSINPDKLRELLFAAGASRVTLSEPHYQALYAGGAGGPPQLAVLQGTPEIIDGGVDNGG